MQARASKRVGAVRAVLLRLVVSFDGNTTLLTAISAEVGHDGMSGAIIVIALYTVS